jgi:hypothetical protein
MNGSSAWEYDWRLVGMNSGNAHDTVIGQSSRSHLRANAASAAAVWRRMPNMVKFGED